MSNRKPFTASEEKFIRDNRLKISSPKIASALGCSKSRVQSYLRKNNLQISKQLAYKFRREELKGRTTFTLEQDEIIKAEYLNLPVKALAEKLGKSGTGLNIRLRQLGLVIPREIIEQRKKDSRYKKGRVAENKGKKWDEFISPEAQERIKEATHFKKGHLPHNAAEKDGAISLRKDTRTGAEYKYIRVSLGNWKPLHYHNWEKKNGPVKEGHVLRFKNGNSLDCRVENLEEITMAENLKRNWHELPKPLKIAIKLTNKIQKQL